MEICNGLLQERLTKETFDSYRKSGGVAIMHMMKPEWIKTGLTNKKTMLFPMECHMLQWHTPEQQVRFLEY
jgi:hypothetical protein